MKLYEILKLDSFQNASILAGNASLTNNASSVMILEATDIEKWGKKEQLILTSYYALSNLSQEELAIFFEKIVHLEISGIVLKPGRLIEAVPAEFVAICEKYKIPLIQIDRKTKYEEVILEILQPIINENSSILNSYYEYRKMISKLSITDITCDDFLKKIKSLLHVDLRLTLTEEGIQYSTLSEIEDYSLVYETELEYMSYVEHNYIEKKIRYGNGSERRIITVLIPNAENRHYILEIFEDPSHFAKRDWMLIENAIEFLQMMLLNRYSVRKNQFVKKNNQMFDLLFTNDLTLIEEKNILNQLGIGKYDFFQAASIHFSPKSTKTPTAQCEKVIEGMISSARNIWPCSAFLRKSQEIIFIFNIPQENILSKNDFSFFFRKHEDFISYIYLSDPFRDGFARTISSLSKMKTLINILHPESHVLSYDDLGFFKLFTNIEKKEDLLNYIPEKIENFYKEEPILAHTLEVFLDQSQNYVKTGNILYVHPKTIRYRINSIKDRLGLDLTDSYQVLTIHVALKVCAYVKLE